MYLCEISEVLQFQIIFHIFKCFFFTAKNLPHVNALGHMALLFHIHVSPRTEQLKW